MEVEDKKELLSNEEYKNESIKYSLINNNDENNKINSLSEDSKSKKIKIKSKFKKFYNITIKIILLILIVFIFNYKIETFEIDLNNYLDKIYGEEDLLTIIKEKEEEKLLSNEKRKKEIQFEIDKIKHTIEQIKLKKKEIINNNKKIIREDGKLILACAYSLNNGFTYPTLVSMTSLVINAGNNIFYNIYILISPDFTEKNKEILMSVEKKYKDHCKVIFINMGNKFEGLDTNFKIPTSSYYRLDLHNLLPDVDRILYMDGDTAIFQDLSDLITLDMKGNYILGFIDSATPNSLEKYNVKDAFILCAGVLLMDLSALRKNNITEKFEQFFKKYLGNIEQHDQTTINVVCHGKISPLPVKYGMWNFKFFREFINHCNFQLPFVRFNRKEIILAYKHPAILHYVRAKPFKNYHKRLNNKYYFKEWWDYAKKTDYYNEIANFAYI